MQRGSLRWGTAASVIKKLRAKSRYPASISWALSLLVLLSLPRVAAAADLQVGQTVSAPRVTAGANVTFNISVTNAGPTSASSITLTSAISPRATFVSSIPSQGACSLVGQSVACDLGGLESNSIASVAITVTTGLGTNENRVSVAAAEIDPHLADNISVRSTVAVVLQEYSNPEAVLLPELDPGPASIYPLNIAVTGVTSAVDKVTVTLRNITHFWPDDLDVLLVGPGGNRVLLLSDCGLDNTIGDVTLTFDDDAAASLPNSDPTITPGTYKPTNFDRLSDTFAPPAPPEPYVTNLAGFKGLSPNGTWSLYVMDDSPENLGYLTDGWTLSLTLSDPLVDLAIAAGGTPASVIVGNTLQYSLAVTNFGPAQSPTFARVDLGAGFVVVGSTASRGSCAAVAGGVLCDFGNLAVGEFATASLELAPNLGGTFTNRVTAITTQYDGNAVNNSAVLVTTVQPVANVGFAAVTVPSTALLGQVINLAMNVTNQGPNVAANVMVTNTLPPSLAFVSGTGGNCSVIAGEVVCSVGAVPSGGSVLLTIAARANSLGSGTNRVLVRSSELDFVPADNAMTNSLQVVPAAEVSLHIVSKRAQAVIGQSFVTQYAISNGGPSIATIAFTNTLPATFAADSAFASRGVCTNFNGVVVCSVNSMASGETVLVDVSTHGTAFGIGTNIAFIASNLPDPIPTDVSVTNEVAIIPGANLSVVTLDSADPVWLGENVTYNIRVTNSGPVVATSVQLTNRLPIGISFLGMTNSAGACSHSGDLVRCEIPSLAVGSNVVISIFGRAEVLGAGTNVTTVFAAEFDFDLANNVFVQPGRVVSSAGFFSNASGITIPDLGSATPYPSTIFVSGLTAAVYRVRVGISGFSHSFADDVDILLVGPRGQSTYLMSDTGGESILSGAVLTFEDDAPPLPDAGPISSNSWRPTNFDGPDSFAAPAPAGPFGTNLTVFNNTDPNGAWSLYVVDDASKDRGSIGEWNLNFATVDPIADLRLAQTISQNPVPVGTSLLLTFLVTNVGPATATDARLTNWLDAALSGISFTASQGTCTLVNRQLTCALGNIPANGRAIVTFSGTPTVAQFVTNIAAVTARETDLNPADNIRSNALDFAAPPVITVQPASRTVTNGVDVVFAAGVAGSAPLSFQWFRNGLVLTNETNATLTLLNVNPLRSGTYQLRVTNRVGFALSTPAVLQVVGPPSFSDIADIFIDEDTSTPVTPFTVVDFETPGPLIEVFAVSSNTNIVRSEDVVFGGTDTNRTFRLTPLPNAFGTLTVFFNAKDSDGGVTTLPVPVTVRSVNDTPYLSPVPDLATTEDTALVIPFIASDVETAPDAIQYRLDSEDARLIVSSGAQFGGDGTNRVLNLTPVMDASGTTTVALVIIDSDGFAVSNRFVVSVAAVNDFPTVDAIADLIVAEDSGTTLVPLTGITSGATNEMQNLQVSATSSQLSVIGPPVVTYQSAGTNGALALTTIPDASGESTITVNVSDGGLTNHLFTRTFRVQVTPVADPPMMSPIPNLTMNEDSRISVPFMLHDAESMEGLTLTAFSSDTNVVADAGLVFSGTGETRALVITPIADRSGSPSIRIVATDGGGASRTNEFLLEVEAVNDPPTLAAIAPLSILEDSGLHTVPLGGITSGATNELQTLTVTATSSDPSVIPSPSVTYASPASTGTLTFTPAINATGSSMVTVTVNDGAVEHNTFSRSFLVTVNDTNDAPTILISGDETMLEDATNAVPFIIVDAETPADVLLLSATSSNPTLISSTNISFSGTGTNRSAVVAPRLNQTGTATIRIFVSDGVSTNSSTFVLTVNPVNDQPTLDPLNNLNVTTSPGVVNVPLTGISSGAANESQTLIVSASTTNPGFFLNQPNVSYSSPNSTGTLSFRPANNATGTATISVTVTDGGGGNAVIVRSFVLTVRSAANVLPTISLIPAQTINEDTPAGPILFTIRDAETAAGSLGLTAFSTNPLLIPDANITLGGSAGNRSISFTPVQNQTGVASIVLTVTDGAFGSSNLAFGVTVNGVNDVPTLTNIPAQTIAEDSATAFLPFTVDDVETPPGLLSVSASSSEPQLIPTNRILLGGSGATRTVQVSPLPNESGSATITLRVTDGAATNVTTFDVTVNPVDDPPVVSLLPDLVLAEDTPSDSIPFTVQDSDSPLGGLTFAIHSSNPALVDSSSVSVTGADSDWSLVVTPKTNQFGEALVALVVADSAGFATNLFRVTVDPVNDPPALNDVPPQIVAADGQLRSVAVSGVGPGADNEIQLVALSATVDNAALISNLHVDHSLGAGDAVIFYLPVAGAVGTATVTLTANDGQATNHLTVRTFTIALNQPPTLAYMPDVATDEDVSTGPISIHLSDVDGAVEQIELTGFASDSALVPASGFSFGGAGDSRNLVLTAATNAFGVTRIFLVATDASGARTTNSFFLNVRSVIDPIVIIREPMDIKALEGSTVVFHVAATSSLPLSYQWQRDDTDLQGEAASSLTLAEVEPHHVGGYRVVISSPDLSVISRTATLTLVSEAAAPTIVLIEKSGDIASVFFESVAGASYSLEYKTSLGDAEWIALEAVAGTGGIQALTDAAAADQTRFYRVRVR